ncbi:hypothetical protein SAMN05216533_4106 [Streptomyces sp. Ag109_O5-10]|nr:hypothetical protein SAMN05216533_4106 [Streptomyces sp. Ag109_O5-10]
MVSKLHQDLDSFERTVPLVGFVGPSQHSERIRLYPRLDFDVYYEIHVADILHRSRSNSGDDGPSMLYVKASGRIEIVSSSPAEDFASSESAGLKSPLKTRTPDPGTFSSTEPTRHSDYPHNPTGDAVRNFANSRLGQEVGGGECTDLVNAALQAAHARPGNFSNPPYYVWGTEITQPPYTDWGTWQNGDIIQFAYAHFQWVYGGATHEWGVGPTGRHTAIIWNGMFSHTGPWETWLIHQNDGIRAVTQRMLWMRHLVSGSFKVYRPIPL